MDLSAAAVLADPWLSDEGYRPMYRAARRCEHPEHTSSLFLTAVPRLARQAAKSAQRF